MNWILLFLLDGRASSGRAFWLDPKEAKQRHSAPIIPPNYYRSFNLIRIIYIYIMDVFMMCIIIYIYSFISYIGYIYIYICMIMFVLCVFYVCMYIYIYIYDWFWSIPASWFWCLWLLETNAFAGKTHARPCFPAEKENTWWHCGISVSRIWWTLCHVQCLFLSTLNIN